MDLTALMGLYYVTPVCGVCGKRLNGVYLRGLTWDCSKCAADKADPMHCERGSRVRYAHENFGYPPCEAEARARLTLGREYKVHAVIVHSYRTELVLEGFPDTPFSATMFERTS